MKNMHHIIIVPGLGDDVKRTKFWINLWPKEENMSYEIWSADWEKYDDSFEQKYKRLKNYCKNLKKEGKVISLIGISAGASLVCTVLAKNPSLIHKVVNICGRLRMEKTGLPTLERITFRNLNFITSIYEFQKNEKSLDVTQRKKIMTLSGMYDELVPVSTIILRDAENRFIPFIGHNFCTILSLTVFKGIVLNFLTSPVE